MQGTGSMNNDNLEEAKRELGPWWPGRRMHRHMVMALIGMGAIPLIRPDLHMEFLFAAWALLPLMSPRIRATIASWFRRRMN